MLKHVSTSRWNNGLRLTLKFLQFIISVYLISSLYNIGPHWILLIASLAVPVYGVYLMVKSPNRTLRHPLPYVRYKALIRNKSWLKVDCTICTTMFCVCFGFAVILFFGYFKVEASTPFVLQAATASFILAVLYLVNALVSLKQIQAGTADFILNGQPFSTKASHQGVPASFNNKSGFMNLVEPHHKLSNLSVLSSSRRISPVYITENFALYNRPANGGHLLSMMTSSSEPPLQLHQFNNPSLTPHRYHKCSVDSQLTIPCNNSPSVIQNSSYVSLNGQETVHEFPEAVREIGGLGRVKKLSLGNDSLASMTNPYRSIDLARQTDAASGVMVSFSPDGSLPAPPSPPPTKKFSVDETARAKNYFATSDGNAPIIVDYADIHSSRLRKKKDSVSSDVSTSINYKSSTQPYNRRAVARKGSVDYAGEVDYESEIYNRPNKLSNAYNYIGFGSYAENGSQLLPNCNEAMPQPGTPFYEHGSAVHSGILRAIPASVISAEVDRSQRDHMNSSVYSISNESAITITAGAESRESKAVSSSGSTARIDDFDSGSPLPISINRPTTIMADNGNVDPIPTIAKSIDSSRENQIRQKQLSKKRLNKVGESQSNEFEVVIRPSIVPFRQSTELKIKTGAGAISPNHRTDF